MSHKLSDISPRLQNNHHALFVGMLRMFNTNTLAVAMAEKSSDTLLGASVTAPMVAPIDYTGYLLIVLGLIGIAYLVYRKYKK